MKYRTIAIDCDDVLVSTVTSILAHYNKTYGTIIALEQLYPKDPVVWGIDDYYVATERVHAYLDMPEYQNMPPFKEAIAVASEHSLAYSNLSNLPISLARLPVPKRRYAR